MWMKLLLWAILLGSIIAGYMGYQTGSATNAVIGIGLFIVLGFILFFFVKVFIHFGLFVVKIILIGTLIGIVVLACLKGCQMLVSPSTEEEKEKPVITEPVEEIPEPKTFVSDTPKNNLWQKAKRFFSLSKSDSEEQPDQPVYIQRTVAKKLPTTFSGKVTDVRSGYLFKVDSHFVKLYGIDAPDPQQKCRDKHGAEFNCGQKSKMMLSRLIEGENVSCQIAGGDYHKNYIATCKIKNTDIGASMTTAGWAVADRATTSVYIPYEEDAHRNKRGLWAGKFVAPWKERAKRSQQVTTNPDQDNGFWGNLF